MNKTINIIDVLFNLVVRGLQPSVKQVASIEKRKALILSLLASAFRFSSSYEVLI